MNRNSYIDRIHLRQSADSEHGEIAAYEQTGTERCVTLSMLLASVASERQLEALISHFSALNEWGGEMFVSAVREKFDPDGRRVEHRDPGEYLTVGYVMHYGHRSSIKGQVHESDTPLASAQLPEPSEEPASNGAEPEPVEA